LDPKIAFEIERPDDAPVGTGETVASVSGPARGVPGAELFLIGRGGLHRADL
jgi:hypothetical protein